MKKITINELENEIKKLKILLEEDEEVLERTKKEKDEDNFIYYDKITYILTRNIEMTYKIQTMKYLIAKYLK